MAILIQDSFTDDNGVWLQDHTPEIGGAWVEVWPDSNGLYINDNAVGGGDNATDIYVQSSIADVLDNGYIQVKKVSAGSRGLMLIFLYNEATGIGASLMIGRGAAGDIDLSGDTSSIFSGEATVGSTFRVEFSGGVATAYKDGEVLGSVNVSVLAYGGKFGLVNPGWGAEVKSCNLDDFEAGTTVAPIVEIERALNYSWYVLNWGPRANFSFRMRPRKRVWVGKNSQKTIRQTEPSLWTI